MWKTLFTPSITQQLSDELMSLFVAKITSRCVFKILATAVVVINLNSPLMAELLEPRPDTEINLEICRTLEQQHVKSWFERCLWWQSAVSSAVSFKWFLCQGEWRG